MSSTIKPTSEQLEFESSIRSFFAEKAGSDYLRKRSASPLASDEALWKGISELGLVSYFASNDAESRGGTQELGIIARQCGEALLAEPLTEAILGGPLCYFHALDTQGQSLISQNVGAGWISSLESGEAVSLLAVATFFTPVVCEVRNKGAMVRVSGKLPFVASAPMAQYLLACLDLGSGVELCLLDLSTGKEQRAVSTLVKSLDLTRAYYEVELINVSALRLTAPALEKMQQLVAVAAAEELAGIAAKAVSMTVEHVKTRKQFGAAIGTFQAVQHRIADMHSQAESMRALAAFGSWALQHSAEQAALTSGAALRYACDHAASIVEGAIQMHGGIGFTWEYDLHLFLRRAKMIELLTAGNAALREQALIAAV